MFSKNKTLRNAADFARGRPVWPWAAVFLVLAAVTPASFGAEKPAGAHFRKEVQPNLIEYCSDCHGERMDKGKMAFDEFKSKA